jgi:prophage antirepressor-like protein
MNPEITNNLPVPLPFDLKGNEVRIVLLDGEMWLVSTDVCGALEYPRVDNALRPVDSDERLVLRKTDPRLSAGDKERLFGPRSPNVSLISESGMYKLIMRSNKPEAKVFQDWVCGEVLPALSGFGAYFANERKLASGGLTQDEFRKQNIELVTQKLCRLSAELAVEAQLH